jgi:hypothetical protein
MSGPSVYCKVCEDFHPNPEECGELEALRKERDELQADCSRLGRAVVGYEKRIQELEKAIEDLLSIPTTKQLPGPNSSLL